MVDSRGRSEAAPGCGAQGRLAERSLRGSGRKHRLKNVTDFHGAGAFNWTNGPIPPRVNSLYSPGRRRPIRRLMTAATELAPASTDTTSPEPAWGHEEFEALSEDEVVGLL